jgi:biopolymer transport protein ExbD
MIEMETRKENTEDALAGSVGQFTASFGLLERLRRPQIKVDVIPVLDLMVLGLLISLLFTRFVMLPGVRVDLPSTDLRMQHTASAVAVLTIGNEGMLFFDGSVYKHNSIERAFRLHVAAAEVERCVLLVKAQAAMELQLFLDLCRMAQEAGFIQVQIAGEKEEAALDLIPGGLLPQANGVPLPVL